YTKIFSVEIYVKCAFQHVVFLVPRMSVQRGSATGPACGDGKQLVSPVRIGAARHHTQLILKYLQFLSITHDVSIDSLAHEPTPSQSLPNTSRKIHETECTQA